MNAQPTNTLAPPRAKAPRWPVRPLLDSCELTVTALARELGIAGHTVAAAARRGLTDTQADNWAVHFGLHPVLVWGWAWIDAAEAAVLEGPAHRPLAEDLRRRIEGGRLRPGDVIPTAQALADHWGISASAAARATAELRRDGLLTGGRGRPNRVAGPRPNACGAGADGRRRERGRRCGECDGPIVPGEEHFPHVPGCPAVETGECGCDLPVHPHCCWICRMEAAG